VGLEVLGVSGWVSDVFYGAALVIAVSVSALSDVASLERRTRWLTDGTDGTDEPEERNDAHHEEQPVRADVGVGPLVVVSCDSHVGPSLAQMREYCPAILRQDYDAFSADIGEKFDIWADVRKVLRDLPDRAEAEAASMRLTATCRPRDTTTWTPGASIWTRRRRRGRHLPLEPEWSTDPIHRGRKSLFQSTGSDLEKAAAGIHIYNHWLADACATAAGAPYRRRPSPGMGHRCMRPGSGMGARVGLRAVNCDTAPGHPDLRRSIVGAVLVCVRVPAYVLEHSCRGAGGDIEFVGNHAQAMLYVDRSGWLSRGPFLAYFSVVCSSVIRSAFRLTSRTASGGEPLCASTTRCIGPVSGN